MKTMCLKHHNVNQSWEHPSPKNSKKILVVKAKKKKLRVLHLLNHQEKNLKNHRSKKEF